MSSCLRILNYVHMAVQYFNIKASICRNMDDFGSFLKFMLMLKLFSFKNIYLKGSERGSIHPLFFHKCHNSRRWARQQPRAWNFILYQWQEPSTWAIIWCLPWRIRIRSGAAETQAGSTRRDVSRASGSWTCYAMMPIAQTFNHTFCYYFSANILNFLLLLNEFSLLKDYYLYERQKVIVSNHWLIGQIPTRQGLG